MKEYALVLFKDDDARVYYSEDIHEYEVNDVATNIVRGRNKAVLIAMAKLARDPGEWGHDPDVDLCEKYRKMRETNERKNQ